MPKYYTEDRNCVFYGHRCQNKSGGYMLGEVGPLCAECYNRNCGSDVVQQAKPPVPVTEGQSKGGQNPLLVRFFRRPPPPGGSGGSEEAG